MKYLAYLLFFGCSLSLTAQSQTQVTTSFENASLIDVLNDIEEKTDITFFYKKEWIDTIKLSVNFDKTVIDLVLKEILGNQQINYLRSNREVILTMDIKVINNPAISEHLDDIQSKSDIQKGLIFKNDYQEDVSNKVSLIEIGSRKGIYESGESVIAGYVIEAENDMPLEGALVYSSNGNRASTTDQSGFYSISLPKGKHTLTIQYLGMETLEQPIVLFSNGKLDLKLEPDVTILQEVSINANRDANVKNVIMGVRKIGVEETKNVPIVLGEQDIMKVATTTAGIQTLGEGASGFNVRGGKSDQNLFLFNGATIYNPSHFFGFFSVFNSDVIESMDVYKSSIPAKYGGRLSGVFDVESLTGEMEEFSGIAGVSPVTSRLTLKIPVIKGKSGFVVGGRTTYSDWLLNSVQNGNFSETNVSFSDLVFRYDHIVNEKNSFNLSTYISKDKFRLVSDSLFTFSDFSFRNLAVSGRWERHFTDQLKGNFEANLSDYGYDLIFDKSPKNAFEQNFNIKEASISSDFNYYKSEKIEWNFGFGSTRYQISPGTRKPVGEESIIVTKKVNEEIGLESFLYLSQEYNINEKIGFSGGFRYSLFSAYGAKTVFSYNEDGPRIKENQRDPIEYKNGEIIKTYHGPEIRLSGRYAFNDLTSLKLSYNRNRQYLHNLTNSEALSPTDIWKQADTHILPQISDQFSIGLYKNLNQNVEVSLETYYKKLQNMLDIKIGSQFLLNDDIETAVLQGPGKSYGLEFSVKKTVGKLNGWINYTYARTFIQLIGDTPEETINNGVFYPTNYDKPHTVNLVANYKLTKRISFSYNFNFSSGRPVTYPTGLYNFKDIAVLHYSERNAYRIPNYMRMDIGVSLEEGHLLKKLTHSYWSFSIYNILGRENPFSVFFDEVDGEINGYKLVVFGNAIPTLSFNFRF